MRALADTERDYSCAEQMPPPNVAFIGPAYVKCLEALKKMTQVGTKAIEGCVTSFLAGLDYGLVGKVVAWVVEKVISTLCDWETKALAIVLRCEYIMRSSKVSLDSAWKAYNLANKCSLCKCIGHNKQNHTSAMDAFLMANNLNDKRNDATELVGAVEEDGWWEWLVGE